MKKLLLILGAVAFVAGCATHNTTPMHGKTMSDTHAKIVAQNVGGGKLGPATEAQMSK